MTSTPSSEAGEGPVLTVITKRLRALKKKLNRITQMEQILEKGVKSLYAEQLDTVRSKPSILEKGVKSLNSEQLDTVRSKPSILEKGVKSLNSEQLETLRSKPSILSAIDELEKIRPLISAAVVEEIALAAKDNHSEYKEVKETRAETEPVEDLLKLIYFGATFDLMEQNDFTTTMLTRAHERQSCLSYDTFSNESDINPLCEKDLDLVAKLGKILMSSPVDLNFSHTYSLQLCVQRAKKWLENSDQPIDSDSNVTYAELRAKLNKIMTSGYFTATPVIQATVDIAATAAATTAAAAAENNIFEVSVGTIPLQLQQTCEEPAVYQENGTYDDGQSSYVEESSKDEFQTENMAKEENSQTDDLNNSQAEEQNNEDSEWKEINNKSRRNDSNHRGGRGGGRRGFPNGRGSRGRGRGGGSYYQNGHSQNHENGKSYPRSYNNNRGRGGNVNNNHGLGPQRVNTVVES